MPTYEYECKACSHRFEKLQRFTDARLLACPKCKKRKAHRLISAGAGFIFRGSGFHVTDYRKGGAPAGPKKTTARKEKKAAPKDTSSTDSGGKA